MSGPRPGCHARQCGDEMQCGRCGLTWDVHDPEPPECSHTEPSPEEVDAMLEHVASIYEVPVEVLRGAALDSTEPNKQKRAREAIAHLRKVLDDETQNETNRPKR